MPVRAEARDQAWFHRRCERGSNALMPDRLLVNLGCGHRFHPDWLNFDLHSSSPAVRECNVVEGVPLPDSACDAVYNAAMLEHLTRPQAEHFLGECHRILKPAGILRIGVPDLERIARQYLEKLEAAASGVPRAAAEYEWMLLELLDQLVRTRSGGLMLEAVRLRTVDERFVVERIGDEFRMMKNGMAAPASRWARLRLMPGHEVRHRLRRAIRQAPDALRRRIAMLFLSRRDARSFREGLFRASGEVHQWMYDRYSLPRLLRNAGFVDPVQRPHSESAIDPNWPRYGLDVDDGGRALKPDLVFIECRKPGAVEGDLSVGTGFSKTS